MKRLTSLELRQKTLHTGAIDLKWLHKITYLRHRHRTRKEPIRLRCRTGRSPRSRRRSSRRSTTRGCPRNQSHRTLRRQGCSKRGRHHLPRLRRRCCTSLSAVPSLDDATKQTCGNKGGGGSRQCMRVRLGENNIHRCISGRLHSPTEVCCH